MTNQPLTWMRPKTTNYSDRDALNDIHALLTGPSPGTEREQVTDISLILTRTGRPMVPVRDIEVSVSESRLGRPVARVDAGDIVMTVRQEPASTRLLIEITSTGQSEAGRDVTVTLDGRCLHHPCPLDGHAA
jgi:hypothetical protein